MTQKAFQMEKIGKKFEKLFFDDGCNNFCSFQIKVSNLNDERLRMKILNLVIPFPFLLIMFKSKSIIASTLRASDFV